MAFQRTLEVKSTSLLDAKASNKTMLFSRKKVQVPTLKEFASIALIEQLGSVENVEKFIKQNPIADLHDCTQSILGKIKTLHQYVVENNVDAVDAFLKETPAYLLSVLLKTKSINQTSAKGLDNHVMVEGTALMMALGAEAVGRDGCDLYFIPPYSRRENTTPKKLALYSDDHPDSPLRYVVEGKEFTIECGKAGLIDIDKYGNVIDQLNPIHFNRLKAMSKNLFLHNKFINLSNLQLEAQQEAYAALLKITKKRGHTEFVNEEGMVEILQRYIKQAFTMEEAEREIAVQTQKQFPEDWEQKEEKQLEEDLKVLFHVRKVISDSTSDQDPKLITAFEQFRKHFEPDAKEILRTGRYGKNRLLLAALVMGYNESYRPTLEDWHKNNVYYNQVIGWLQRLAQDNVKQAMAQGLYYTLDMGKKSNCSLKCTYGNGHFIVSDTSCSGVGFDSWIYLHLGSYAHGMQYSLPPRTYRTLSPEVFSKLCSSKNSGIAKIYAAARHILESLKKDGVKANLGS